MTLFDLKKCCPKACIGLLAAFFKIFVGLVELKCCSLYSHLRLNLVSVLFWSWSLETRFKCVENKPKSMKMLRQVVHYWTPAFQDTGVRLELGLTTLYTLFYPNFCSFITLGPNQWTFFEFWGSLCGVCRKCLSQTMANMGFTDERKFSKVYNLCISMTYS
jgi:hypothetical protein